MKIINLDRVERGRAAMEGAKDVWKQLPISSVDGVPGFSFRVFTIDPGGHTPYHTHPFEHLNYVINGVGTIVTESGEEREIIKGDFALIHPEEKHQYRNPSGESPLTIICAVPKEYE